MEPAPPTTATTTIYDNLSAAATSVAWPALPLGQLASYHGDPADLEGIEWARFGRQLKNVNGMWLRRSRSAASDRVLGPKKSYSTVRLSDRADAYEEW
jgi:hypothetical protein